MASTDDDARTDAAAAETDEAPGPVPQWAELPDYVQHELTPCGYDAAWFTAQAPVLRLTVLNLYVKLKGLGLWRFVGTEHGSQPGCLHFLCTDIEELRAFLTASSDFTTPQESKVSWDSRERRAVGALHFKQFDGWPVTKVQAHIDPHGLLLHSELWWLIPVVPLGQMLAHAADPTGYTEVYRIRNILLQQGWDPAPLTGRRGPLVA